MNESDSVSIESLPQFRELVRNSCVDVVWVVRCEIGPDWIGSGRDIKLYHEGKGLTGSFCDALISAIITALSIPGETPDSVISGEGEVSIHDEKLILKFEWEDSIPYSYRRDSGHGAVELDGLDHL